jgi:hypothetical protein
MLHVVDTVILPELENLDIATLLDTDAPNSTIELPGGSSNTTENGGCMPMSKLAFFTTRCVPQDVVGVTVRVCVSLCATIVQAYCGCLILE